MTAYDINKRTQCLKQCVKVLQLDIFDRFRLVEIYPRTMKLEFDGVFALGRRSSDFLSPVLVSILWNKKYVRLIIFFQSLLAINHAQESDETSW